MTNSTSQPTLTSQDQLREAAVRPMQKAGPAYWILFALFMLLVLAGFVAWIVLLRRGFVVTGLDHNTAWGVLTVNIVTFIGLSYGGALVSAILRLTGAAWRTPITRIAEATALVTLVIGAVFPIIHMGRPERVWRLFVEPRGSSPMVWDTYAILTYLIATIIFFYLALISDFGLYANWPGLKVGRFRRWILRTFAAGWQALPAQKRVLERALIIMSIMIIPIAVYVHSVLAWAFSLNSRPGWHSTIFAPYFVVAALYSGVALVIVAASIYRWAYRLQDYITLKQIRNLSYLLLTLGLVYAYFTFAELLTEGYTATEEGTAITALLLTGYLAKFYWSWMIGGLLVPILLIALPWTRNIPGITIASLLVIVGMWVKRFLIVVPAMELSLISKEFVPYQPSWVEMTMTLGAVAAIPLLLMIVFRFVPVLPVVDIEEEAQAENSLPSKEFTQRQSHLPRGAK